jgi:hypothetical protein
MSLLLDDAYCGIAAEAFDLTSVARIACNLVGLQLIIGKDSIASYITILAGDLKAVVYDVYQILRKRLKLGLHAVTLWALS